MTSRLPEYLGDGFVVFCITVFLLWIPSGSYKNTSGSKYSLFLIACLVYLGLILIDYLRRLAYGERRQKIKITLFFWLLFAYVLFSAISAILSPYKQTFSGSGRNDGLATILIYALCAWSLSRTFRPKRWLLPLLGAAVLLYCAIGFLQLMGKNPFGLYPNSYNYYDKGIRYSGIFLTTSGNIDSCAYNLSMTNGIFLAALTRLEEKKKWFLVLPLIVSAIFLFTINVEAGIVALLAGIVLLPPVIVKNLRQLGYFLLCVSALAFAFAFSATLRFYDGGIRVQIKEARFLPLAVCTALVLADLLLARLPCLRCRAPKKLWLALTLVSASLILASLVLVYYTDSVKQGFLYEAHEILHGRIQDKFGSGRIEIWKNVWQKIKERPLFGGGPDTLGQRGLTVFRYFDGKLGRWRFGTVNAAHNEYLNIFVNQGVFALLSYLGLLAVSVRRWIKQRDDDLCAIAGAGALLYGVNALFGISMCYTTLYFWILLALLHKKEE